MVRTVAGKPPNGDALDQLEYEDRALLQLLEDFEKADDRLDHGIAGKLFVEHLAVREAARESIAASLSEDAQLSALGEQLEHGTAERRTDLGRLDELARGVQPINLNQGQNFDAAMASVAESLRADIRLDLENFVPALRGRLTPHQRRTFFKSAKWVRSHAPTHPNPKGRRPHERLSPVVRLHAVYDWLRGFPTGGTGPSGEVDIPQDNQPL